MYERWGKRLAHAAGAAALLLLLAPLMATVACAVLLALGRPVLFRQARAGRGGRPFVLLKFRSMAEGPGDDAARLGRFGRALRASALDELPQLLNVLRGEMSLVGPRPLPTDYLALFTERQALRLRSRPGLAGLAQAAGRNAVPWERRLALDARYASRPARPGADAAILLRCLMLLLRGHGASAPGHATMPAFGGSPGREHGSPPGQRRNRPPVAAVYRTGRVEGGARVERFGIGPAAAVALGLLLAGCDGFPRDAESTLERVRAGGRPLRAGWSPAEPWVRAGDGHGDGPAGLEPDLLRAWAASVGARVEWVPGGEAQLVQALGSNAVDVAVAGFADGSPWGGRIGQTQPYLEAEVSVGAASGVSVPRSWKGVEIRHDRRRPDIAAAIRGIGAVPVAAADGGGMAPLAAAYAPELEALGLAPTGKTLRTERRVIATAPAENALALSLDRFLHGQGSEIGRRLAAEARR